jgi:hypothetical protein
MGNKVLIISYTFPPYDGIGGRRWAKFSKYLNYLDYELSIIAAKQEKIKKYDKDFDIINYADNIKYIKSNYPEIISKIPKILIEKIWYNISLIALKILCKGNYYDKAVFLKRKILDELEEGYKKGFKNIIISGAPFNLLYYGALFKKKHSDINLIIDFRDGWTWDGRYGIDLISNKRKEHELKKELFTLSSADIILHCSNYHKDITMELYPFTKNKTYLISHAYDKEELPELKNNTVKEDFFVYGGTLYDWLEPVFESLN